MTRDQLITSLYEARRYDDPVEFAHMMLVSCVFLPPDDPDAPPDLSLVEPLTRIWRAACLPSSDLLTELAGIPVTD